MISKLSNFEIRVSAKPECKDFLKIKMPDGDYMSVDEFCELHPCYDEEAWRLCVLNYRGKEILFQDYNNDRKVFSENMGFIDFVNSAFLVDNDYRAASYFVDRAAEWLQFARFFIIKSSDLISDDVGYNRGVGYVPHFQSRCIYFGTAATWLSNTFDQILQSVYWGFHLYSEACDKEGNQYDPSWDVKKTLSCCTYEFVVAGLKTRGLTTCRKLLTQCSTKTEEVRKWANYIKHKGGIDYKYLNPELDCIICIENKGIFQNFRSPVEIDIDKETHKLAEGHKDLYDCINGVIACLDFNGHELNIGG